MISVHCQWSAWIVGSCSKSCGGGQQTKQRTKLVTESDDGKCSGQSSVTESCNTISCNGKSVFILIQLHYVLSIIIQGYKS